MMNAAAVDIIEVINPATGQIVGRLPKQGQKEAKQAADAAHNAFSEWSGRTAEERSVLLMNWHRLISQSEKELAKLMTKEQGKPLKEALGEIRYANSYISWYAEEGKRLYGQTIPASDRNKRIIVQKQPVGVVAAITPWNFPAAMITRKVAPALAAGCTVVVKPSEFTPLTAFKLAELAYEAGIPRDVLAVVAGDPAEIGDTWMKDGRIRKLSFTGSTGIGKLLMKKAADTMKKLSLELGGHAPFIVMPDADLDQAVEGLIASKYRNAGQTCICTNRVFVHESCAGAFTGKLAEAVSKLKVGNGLDAGTDIGPVINQAALEKVKAHVEDAVLKGALLLSGGREHGGQGTFFEPTVIAGATDDMLCMKEETFGPLAPVATFQTMDEVIRRANNTPYGLAAYLYTKNLSDAIRISEGLEYGIVGINDGLPSVSQAPFGGWKQSGLGREGGHYGLDEYVEVKYISMHL
ncbi:NAD-dependent succinate-semialdehyde dehydrogenase [Domibacillus sp. PGB-M46]|uniref:NAD-dependent succinate-semialdehyde dehydrogenase n=1 Tax=Domibacillus sp. PGB-M46 TaxID=2910255 RepID=UPI001F5826E1|nr:NAD-dependent succinate-semialdehyde dehydrogenase [Domibacillus sp. PGB-M46]MCI2254913.1 NAD-dependent succinate-semialdehyde dehydrogenase [Domibacillus sp. PGB-M46]